MRRFYFRGLLASLCFLASASVSAYDFEVDGIFYGIDGETAYVTYETEPADMYQGKYYGDLEIPETVEYDGKTYTVTAIGDKAFYGSYNITSITLPNTLKKIGEHAFDNCRELYEIEIPGSVESIGKAAFMFCSGLEGFVLPRSVTHVGSKILYCCFALEYIEVEPGNPVYDSREDCFAIIETATNTMIQGCTYSFIPTSVTSLGEGAMASTSMRRFEIPTSVKTLGNDAFQGCSELIEITIPNSVTTIGEDAFNSCIKLEEVTLPASLTKIGAEAFTSCIVLEVVYCEATTPPSWVGDNVFDSYRIGQIRLYVPTDCRPTYQAARGWKQFKDIREYTPDGIDGVKPGTSVPAEIFTLSGKKVSDTRKGGIYIFRHADGKAYKRMMK